MATSIYISSAEGSSGKSTIALGILDALRARVERVGASSARTISPAGEGVAVMVIPTNEELEIALQSAEVLGGAR